VTRNQVGPGEAWYVATDPSEEFVDAFLDQLLAAHDIRPPLSVPPGVEVTLREKDGRQLLFVLNHTAEPAHIELGTAAYHELLKAMNVTGTLTLAPRDVRILTPSS
jgi:beta-galactosidase